MPFELQKTRHVGTVLRWMLSLGPRGQIYSACITALLSIQTGQSVSMHLLWVFFFHISLLYEHNVCIFRQGSLGLSSDDKSLKHKDNICLRAGVRIKTRWFNQKQKFSCSVIVLFFLLFITIAFNYQSFWCLGLFFRHMFYVFFDTLLELAASFPDVEGFVVVRGVFLDNRSYRQFVFVHYKP